MVRGADDAAAAPADAKVPVGGKALREYSYATGTPIAATPSLTEERGGVFVRDSAASASASKRDEATRKPSGAH